MSINELLADMTLAEKIGQMTQVENLSIEPEAVEEYTIGSVLSGGGGNPTPNTPEAWAAMVASYEEAALRSRLGIPLLYGVDAVHGHNNVGGFVAFPHNIGLGATGDPELVGRVASVTAEELLATGIRWDFAPPLSIPQDIRWGRTYECYSQDPELVTTLAMAFLEGLQGTKTHGLAHPWSVLGCVKHYVADGATNWGTANPDLFVKKSDTADASNQIEEPDNVDPIDEVYGELYRHGEWGQQLDQGVANITEAQLRAVHLPPYIAAFERGARCIMVSLSSWNDEKLHGHRYLLTDVLKGELGFDGMLVSDWLAIDNVDPDFYVGVAKCINAGVDMVMVPHDYERFIETLTRAVENGDVPMARIEDAVRRILTTKAEMGLFDGIRADRELVADFGSAAHRVVAREAAGKSQVLLKNKGEALPLSKDAGLMVVAGRGADDIGLQCGGWTIEWRGITGGQLPGDTLLDAVRATVSKTTEVVFDATGCFEGDDRMADVGLVVIAEPPYAEMTGDRADLTLPPEDVALIESMSARCRNLVGILYSGRPLIITEQLDLFDAFVAAWLPGSEGRGLTDVLFGDLPFTGRLPLAWPRDMSQVPLEALAESVSGPLWPLGYGLSTSGELVPPSKLHQPSNQTR